MNKAITYMVGAGVIGVIAIAGNQATKKERAEAMERFSVTEREAPMMQTCERILSANNLEFKSGVSEISACACVARQLTDSVRPEESAAAASFLSLLISSSGDDDFDDAKFVEGIMHLQQTYKLSESRTVVLTSAASETISHCGDPRNLQTAEEAASRKAALEEMKRNRAAKTAEACEEVRRRGIQTDRCDGK